MGPVISLLLVAAGPALIPLVPVDAVSRPEDRRRRSPILVHEGSWTWPRV